MSDRYMSYDHARSSGGKDVWPGCGREGRCMPCGSVHNFDYKSGERWVNDFRCSRNHNSGCPIPKPLARHDFNAGKCRDCGKADLWLAPDDTTYRTIKAAKKDHWRRHQIVRSSERPQREFGCMTFKLPKRDDDDDPKPNSPEDIGFK